MKRGLLVDDDALYLRALQRALERRGFEIATASTAAAALACARRLRPDFALVDLKLDGETGLELIAPLRALRADMRVILVTGYASVATAVEAIKRGADNYLPKPATVPMILRVLAGEPLPPEVDTQMTPMNRLEWEHIQQALTTTAGNISAAARMLGMHRRSLQRKLAKRPARERTPADELD
jgi:two-component system response regulator RegA